MTVGLRILCMCAGFFVFLVTVRLLIRCKMDEANSFLWIPLGVGALISGFFPEVVAWISAALGVQNPPTLVLIAAIVLVILILLKNTLEISIYKSENHELSMQVSMLNSEVRGLIEFCKRLQGVEAPAEAPQNQFRRPL